MSEAIVLPLAVPQTVSTIRRELARLDESEARHAFDVPAAARLLKTTISLCAECLGHVPAAVFAMDGRVLLRKRCERHGAASAVLENDESFYFLSNKDRSGRRYADDRLMTIPEYEGGGCCGPRGSGCATAADSQLGPYTDQLSNKSCTVLVEVTDACNLACPVCYSDAKGERKMPLASFRDYILRLIEQKGGLDSVQLTGGEALLHPEVVDMIAFLYAQPAIKKIYLPTNGLLLASGDLPERLIAFRDKLMVLLQFDAADVAANRTLRAANPASARQRVIERLDRLGIAMQLTMTLTRGVNDSQVGWVVAQGLARRNVRVIALQPVTYSGRYELPPDPLERLTLSDMVKAICAQVRPRVAPEEFAPIPCSHPNCGWITLFVRRFGLVRNVMRFIDLPAVMNEVAYKTLLSTKELQHAVGSGKRDGLLARLGKRLVRSSDIFTVAIKPFMDRFNYDQDRIANCCHHLMDTRGRAVSFCEYNAIVRPTDPWTRLPRLHDPA
ncbi:MAG TPA: radical SAM protein [Thermoanaerobaculia bacterium]